MQFYVDISAAKEVASTVGLGFTQHVQVLSLRLEDAVRRRTLEIRKFRKIRGGL